MMKLTPSDLGFGDLAALSVAELKQMVRDDILTALQLAEILREQWKRRGMTTMPMLGGR